MGMKPAKIRPANLAVEIGKRRPFDLPEQEAFLNVARTYDHVLAAFERLLKGRDLSAPQYNVLRIVRGHGRAPTRKIAEQMISRQPDITRLIDRLETTGLVKRERCRDDRRVVWVQLTPQGQQVLRELDKPVLEMHKATMGHMGARKLAMLNKLLFEARHGPASDARD
ncbi:MAG: MarR family transcriptional regulator [Planctomycetia bacterium]